MAKFGVAHIDEIEERTDGRRPFRSVRLQFGIETFGATTWTAKAAGDQLINEHDESDPNSGDELYLVVNGHARFVIDGEDVDAPQGTFVNVARDVMRCAFAEEAGTMLFVVGAGKAGEVYTADDWESWSPLIALFGEKRYEDFLEGARPLLREEKGHGTGYYNIACAESLLGDTDAALADLRTALRLSPELTELARGDDDFAALRARPEFGELVGS